MVFVHSVDAVTYGIYSVSNKINNILLIVFYNLMNELPNDNIDFDLTFIMEKRYFIRTFMNKIWRIKIKKVYIY